MRLLRTFVFLMLAILATSVSGCVMGTQREGRVLDPKDIATVEIGVTTKQEILDLFGPPTSFQRMRAERPPLIDSGQAPIETGEDVYLYEYVENHETFFSAILLYTYFLREELTDRLMVVFDREDRVKYLAFSKETEAEPEPDPEPEPEPRP